MERENTLRCSTDSDLTSQQMLSNESLTNLSLVVNSIEQLLKKKQIKQVYCRSSLTPMEIALYITLRLRLFKTLVSDEEKQRIRNCKVLIFNLLKPLTRLLEDRKFMTEEQSKVEWLLTDIQESLRNLSTGKNAVFQSNDVSQQVFSTMLTIAASKSQDSSQVCKFALDLLETKFAHETPTIEVRNCLYRSVISCMNLIERVDGSDHQTLEQVRHKLSQIAKQVDDFATVSRILDYLNKAEHRDQEPLIRVFIYKTNDK
jgi:hypothetical protein